MKDSTLFVVVRDLSTIHPSRKDEKKWLLIKIEQELYTLEIYIKDPGITQINTVYFMFIGHKAPFFSILLLLIST